MKRFDKEGNVLKISRRCVAPKYLTVGERRKVLEYLKRLKGFEARRDRMIFQLGMLAGLRVEEMRHTDVGDFYPMPQDGPRRISNFIPVVGKGNVYREIPLRLSSDLYKEVEAYLKAKKAAGESFDPLAPFFCAPGGARLSYRSLQDIVTRACVKAGLVMVDPQTHRVKARYSIHSLRHTFAVAWLGAHRNLSAGEAYKKLSLLMGHGDIRTTQKYTLLDIHEADDEI